MKSFLSILGFAAALALPVAAAGHACAVPESQHATLQSAFDDAACDPIQIAAGTYFGNFAIHRPVTVHGAGAGVTILDGQNQGRVVTIIAASGSSNRDPNFVVVLTGMTIQHGNERGTGFLSLVGGGIADFGGPLVLNDCDVSNNTASQQDDRTAGGGVYAEGGDLSILHSTVTSNSSGGFAGGIENENGNAIIVDSIVSGNTSRTLAGGVEIDGLTAAVSRCQISNNRVTAGPGGGIADEGGPLAIDHSSVVGNHAGDYGGGVISEGGDLRMIGCIVSDNVAAVEQGGGIVQAGLGLLLVRSAVSGNAITGGGEGGGLLAEIDQGEPVRIESSTFFSNNAGSGSGGGIFLRFRSGPDPVIVNTTVAANSAATSGGIAATHDVSTTTTLDVVNTIVSGNAGGDCHTMLIRSLGHNIARDGSCLFNAPGDHGAVDPKLGAFATTSPWTLPTLPLLAGSPAIDAGDDALAPGTDERGSPRGGAHSDIGAFEVIDPTATVIPVEEVDLRLLGGSSD